MVRIGDKYIGDNQACFITFEIGPTHNGVDSAKRLIKHAKESGADAVKFQICDPDRLVSDKDQLFSYGVLKDRETGEIETVEEPLYDIIVRRSLNKKQWKEVKSYCDEQEILFFATVAFDDEIDFLVELECHSIKIASADVNHFPLLRRAARTGMNIQLDTGMSTLGEVEAAVDVISSEGNENIIIHQCPSGYPARLESINLNIIPTLKQLFPYPVAFSDHTLGFEMDIAAIALGANLLEKTITEDRMTRSVEHVMSIEPPEMKAFIQTIRDVEIGIGSSRRKLHKDEKNSRDAVRRSVFIKKDAEAGQRLGDCQVEFRRPGFGITPDRYEELLELKLTRDIAAGHMLTLKDLCG
jgi:N,N'-diacetyllegionaminate synthase